MKYLCLIYDAESTMAAMPKDQMDAFMGEYFAFSNEIAHGGQMVAGEELEPVHTATTVRIRNGKMTTTDGPFAETREHLGGYYVIDVANLDAALTYAAIIPSAHFGTVEVRPLMDYNPAG